MRSLFKISLAILAMSFLAVAGSAFAQEMAKPTMTITGDIGAGFGIVSFDKTAAAPAAGSTPANTKAFSEWTTSYESNIRFTWTSDQLTLIGRMRARANTEGSAGSGNNVSGGSTISGGSVFQSSATDFYTEAWWTPGAFKVGIGKFQGQAWSQPFSGAYVILSPIESLGNNSSNEYWMNWTGIPGLDAEYNLGIVQVGLALSSVCRPSCNVAQANSSAAPGVYTNTQSITPHVAGKTGDISFRAQFPQTSASIAAAPSSTSCKVSPPAGSGSTCSTTNTFPATGDTTETKTASGSGYQVGAQWAGMPGLAVGLDFSSFTDTKIADLGQQKDRTRTSYQVKVDAPVGPGTVTVAYFSIDDNNSANGADVYGGSAAATTSNTYTSTKTTLRYTYPVSFGAIMPEYVLLNSAGAVTPTAPATKQSDASDNLIRVVIKGTF